MASDKRSFLIIVTGAPAAGKTTVGRRLAEAFGLPFIYKDGIKEIWTFWRFWKSTA
jgi:shikimate kinase